MTVYGIVCSHPPYLMRTAGLGGIGQKEAGYYTDICRVKSDTSRSSNYMMHVFTPAGNCDQHRGLN